MSAFLTPLEVRDKMDGTWIILSRFRYESDKVGGVITVPAGFVTDYASTPQIVWALMPRQGEEYDGAAVVHDWIYNQHEFPRDVCDAVFREAMLVKGVNRFRAWVMWKSVRWFGWMAYNREKRQRP